MFREVVWKLLLPFRSYVKKFPYPRGKGLIVRYILKPALPGGKATFCARLPGGGMADLEYREKIGFSTLLKGPFEKTELECVKSQLGSGDVALDVGANIGIYSIVMGLAVGRSGRVLAFEPFPDNITRLKKNLGMNGLNVVEVCEQALTDSDGETGLFLSEDSAYPSTIQVKEGMENGRRLSVKTSRLDTVWEKLGKPVVKVIKIDVEGAEVGVIRGGLNCIASCNPLLLIEANGEDELEKIKCLLEPMGYSCSQPEGFHPWNWLFRV